MPFIRQYRLTAKTSQQAALSFALSGLAQKVRPQSGCEEVRIYRDTEAAEKFLFVEQWTSQQDQENAGKALGKDAFAPIILLIAEPPNSADLEPAQRTV